MEQLDMILPYKGALVIGALAGFLVLERLFPMARLVHGLRQIGRNLSLAGINAVLSWLVVVPVSAFAAQWALDWRPAWWGGWTGLALDLLILDCWIYWWHRANHEIPFLWRFHEVH
ncbi:MAG: sterol desaturase family protein, partial [Aestuariivirga sp.]